MNPETKKLLSAVRAPVDLCVKRYDLGFFAIGYERRSRFVASCLCEATNRLCGFEYQTEELAIEENKSWARDSGALVESLGNFRTDRDGSFCLQIQNLVEENTTATAHKLIFVDVSSMDRSLIARLLASLFSVVKPPFMLRICYAPAKFLEPEYVFVPVRECAPAIPELAGELGAHQSSVSLLLGLGFEFGVSLGLLQQLEPDQAVIFVPEGVDPRYDRAVRKANFDLDFGLDNARVFPYLVDQPLSTFESLFTLTSNASITHRVVLAPNGPKMFAALATVIGLYRMPNVTVLRASLASRTPEHHVEADGSIVAIDFQCL
jgi:hypothetical protein